MALATQSPPPRVRSSQRIWRAPISRLCWLWLTGALALCAGAFLVYVSALSTQAFPGPFSDPLRSLGMVAIALVLIAATYILRRRFVRSLPGKVQNWLWMHTWLGCAALLIALLHENFTHILHDICPNAGCLTGAYGGTAALLALVLLVLSGAAGRLLDFWQAQSIAHDASTNGAGIVQAVAERLLEQESIIERLCAGKSEEFQQVCLLSLAGGSVPEPVLAPQEQADFAHARQALLTHARLSHSLKSQQRARWVMRNWRRLHMALAILAFFLLMFHATMELLSNVFHVF
jgi:hypothetical protein